MSRSTQAHPARGVTARADTQGGSMSRSRSTLRFKPWLLACAGLAALMGMPAYAQDSAQPAPAPQAAPAGAPVMVDARSLLDQMVAEGIATRDQADRMLGNLARSAPSPQAVAAAPTDATQVAAGEPVHTVPYIPAPVLNQIRDQVRTELASQANREGWARPGELPEWTRRITLFGDVRLRGEGVFFPNARHDANGALVGGNYDQFVDFAAINRAGGYDINPATNPFNPPYLNTTRDRDGMRLRARLGLHAQIDDWVSAEVRLATGNDSSPVSPNQPLGGGGAEFGKYAIWLDRANIRLTPTPELIVDFGRSENPFWTTSLMFDPDLNFDGVSVRYATNVTDGLRLFGTAGAFPIYNTAFNFGSNDVGSFRSRDKWLGAAQVGGEWQASEALRLSAGVGYFHFGYMQGYPQACGFLQDACPSDTSAFQFNQFGNTVIALRNNAPDPAAPAGQSPDPQLFGFASRFHVLEARGQIEWQPNPNFMVRLDGEYVRNLWFDRSDVGLLNPFNNLEGANYFGGDDGWYANLTLGRFARGAFGDTPILPNRGDWFASVGYKFLQSDAIPDAFTDSDFHLGGTNARGYILGAGYAFARGTSLSARYLSAQEASGPDYKVDVLMIDLTTRF